VTGNCNLVGAVLKRHTAELEYFLQFVGPLIAPNSVFVSCNVVDRTPLLSLGNNLVDCSYKASSFSLNSSPVFIKRRWLIVIRPSL
jgi:hypothetical protein